MVRNPDIRMMPLTLVVIAISDMFDFELKDDRFFVDHGVRNLLTFDQSLTTRLGLELFSPGKYEAAGHALGGGCMVVSPALIAYPDWGFAGFLLPARYRDDWIIDRTESLGILGKIRYEAMSLPAGHNGGQAAVSGGQIEARMI